MDVLVISPVMLRALVKVQVTSAPATSWPVIEPPWWLLPKLPVAPTRVLPLAPPGLSTQLMLASDQSVPGADSLMVMLVPGARLVSGVDAAAPAPPAAVGVRLRLAGVANPPPDTLSSKICSAPPRVCLTTVSVGALVL